LRLPEFEEASVALAQREPGDHSLQEAVAFYLHRIGREPAKNLERLLSRLRILIGKPNDEIVIYWLGFVDSAEPARSLLRELSKKSEGAVSELTHIALKSLSLRCPEKLTPPTCKQDPWLAGK
jgi:hypothetical protein